MKEGDALSISVAGGKAKYERIVEWIIPDTRNEDGHLQRRESDDEESSKDAWDAIRFRNPLGFPMTTCAATFVARGCFVGQTMSFFVNTGEQATLKVTKALSIRTRSVEQEEGGNERPVAWIGDRNFRKVSVKGEVGVNNHRKEEIKMIIRRRFSGELVSADGEPKKTLCEEGVYSVNPREELVWTLTLKPDEEKTFVYRYTVLVRH
ncbi:MAG: hypothetical protein V1899_05010 [Planctomycetota bacterium]